MSTLTKDEIIYKLWELSGHGTEREDIERAYAAGAAAEREACARVCEQEWNEYCNEPSGYALAVNECAAAIRARGQS